MKITDLIQRFKHSREKQQKAIFSTLFIAQNRLQTAFDKDNPLITLKQFMLLTMVRQSGGGMTFTQLGKLLGCSRQNIKKLAFSLEQKGFVQIRQSENDSRAAQILPADKLHGYFDNAAEMHQEMLGQLFADYSDAEIEQFFALFMKLYRGIERLEQTHSRQLGNSASESERER